MVGFLVLPPNLGETNMEPWPPVLVFFWRFIVIPFFVVFAVVLAIAGMNAISAPWRMEPGFGFLVIAVVVVNLIVYRLEAHTRRMNALEQKLDALQQRPPESANS
jgi:membrane protein YdbS with pleckstrin-like domain